MSPDSEIPPDDTQVRSLFADIERRQQPAPHAQALAQAKAHQVWQELLAQRQQQRKRWAVLAIAATVVLGLASSSIWQSTTQQQWPIQVTSGELTITSGAQIQPTKVESATPVRRSVQADAVARVQQTTRLTTENGTELRLREGTEVRWLSATRLSLQRGQIYVDTHDKANFTVVTTLAEIKDVGTRYLVTRSSTQLEVAVRSGTAIVRTDNKSYRAQAQPGQAAVAELQANAVVRQYLEPAAGRRWDWIHDASEGYRSTAVATVLTAIAKDLGKELQYASPGDQAMLANETYAGSLQGLTPRAALRLLAGSANLSWREDATALIIAVNEEPLTR